MKIALTLLVALSLSALTTLASPPSSNQVIADAKTKASAEQKAIFVHFGASWCGWCKRLDAFLDRKDVKQVFEKYFIPVKLVVHEKEKDKALENAGAEALLTKLGGPSGLPYSAFLDSKGDLIVNSKDSSGNNIGFPAQPDEIDYFVKMMKKAAPNMSEQDLKVIETALSQKT
jgi:thioredoxin-related protein